VLRTETDLTNLLFTASDKNSRYFTTLQQTDIRVLEDGVPQTLFTFQRETDRPLAIAFVIDVSISEEKTLPDEKAAARTFVEKVIRSDKDQAAIVPFEGYAHLEQPLTRDVIGIYRALDAAGATLEAGMREAATRAKIPVQFNRCGSMFCGYFTEKPVHNLADGMRSDRARFGKFFHGMLQEGVQIDLIIRGICTLRPGVPGMSENIRVRSIVGQLLEHSRIYYFENGGHSEVYIGSSDWMPRNLDRRVEVITPIEDVKIKWFLKEQYLEAYLRDNEKATDTWGFVARKASPNFRPPAAPGHRIPAPSCRRGRRRPWRARSPSTAPPRCRTSGRRRCGPRPR